MTTERTDGGGVVTMTYETIRVQPLTRAIGAEVEGIDLREPLTDRQVAELRAALLEHLVLFLRDQDLTDAQHIEAASRFGTPNVYPATRARGLDEPIEWIEDTPDSPPKTDLWHTDVAFLPEPPDIGMINLRVVPPAGGDTMWASLYAVHDRLSPTLQQVVARLDQDLHPGQDQWRKLEAQFGTEVAAAVEREFQGSRHPLVRVHPETGRRALFLCGRFLVGLADLHADESEALMTLLRAGLEDPGVQCRWRWQPHDVAIWDERCTNHRGLSDHYPERRLLRRCTVGAGRPIGPRDTVG